MFSKHIFHSGPAKNSWNQINNFFSWNCIFCSFKLFSSWKINFWPFLKLQKMEFGQKENFMKLFYLISRVFWPGLFFNFLAHCGLIPLNTHLHKIYFSCSTFPTYTVHLYSLVVRPSSEWCNHFIEKYTFFIVYNNNVLKYQDQMIKFETTYLA